MTSELKKILKKKLKIWVYQEPFELINERICKVELILLTLLSYLD